MSLIRRFTNLFHRTKLDREIDDELQAHIALRTDDNVAAGMSPTEANRDARLRFGNRTATREHVAAADSALHLARFAADLRFACRQLVRNPGYALVAILVLALGIGSSTAIFAFVDGALIRPLPFANPSRLVSVYEVVPSCPLCNISYQNWLDWKKAGLPFSSLQAWGWASYLIHTPQGTEPARGARVSDGFFRTLGVTPMLGRDFHADEDAPGQPHTVLLSYGAWQKRFGANPAVVGQSITLSNIPYTIIGVLPREYHFAPLGEADFWAALNDPNDCDRRRACHGLFGLARLQDGASFQAAAAAMKNEAALLAGQYPDSNHGCGATAIPLTESIMGNIRPVLQVLLAGALLLLVIACVNVSALLLVRTESRKQETAVRAALGATAARLFAQFAAEACVLIVAGSLLGLSAAALTIHLLVKLVPADRMESMPFLLSVGLTPHVLFFALGVSFLAALGLAVGPTIRIPRRTLRGDLAEGERGSSGTTWRRLGNRLIVVELATAVVLLAGAGLLGKSFYLLLHADLGMKPDNLAILVVAAPRSYADDNRLRNFEQSLLSRVGNLPGVNAVGIGSHLPARDWDGGVSIEIPGRPNNGARNDLPERDVSPTYFQAVGATLLRGRYLATADGDEKQPAVIVVNHTLANKLFPGENVIGKHLAYEGSKTSMEIVGEIQDIKEGQLDSVSQPAIYVPFDRDPFHSFYLFVRTSSSPDAMLPTIAAAIHQIDSAVATSDETTMNAVVEDSTSAYLHRASASLVGGFAGVALLLSIVGLYGVVAYSVSRRTREIGVRMALGAQRSSVHRMVLGGAVRLTAIGIVLGLVGALAASTLLRKLLFATKAWDLPTLVAVAGVMAAAALLASYIPARRAASIDPMRALRSE